MDHNGNPVKMEFTDDQFQIFMDRWQMNQGGTSFMLVNKIENLTHQLESLNKKLLDLMHCLNTNTTLLRSK